MNNKLSELIINTLHYPPRVFENISFADDGKDVAFKKLCLLFDEKDWKPDLDNPNYGQLLRLIILALRNEKTKKWIDYLINEFKRFHEQYKSSHNFLLGGNLITFLSYLDKDIKSILTQILFNLKDSEGKTIKVLSYKVLTPEQQIEVKYQQQRLMEIKSLSDVIRLRMSHLNEVHDTKSLYKFGFLQIVDIFNLFEKIHKVFQDLYNIKILNTYLDEFRFIRHSIAHSHFIYTEIKNEKVMVFEYYDVNYSKKTAKPFERRPLNIAVEMLLITTILCQILVLYQLFFQNRD